MVALGRLLDEPAPLTHRQCEHGKRDENKCEVQCHASHMESESCHAEGYGKGRREHQHDPRTGRTQPQQPGHSQLQTVRARMEPHGRAVRPTLLMGLREPFATGLVAALTGLGAFKPSHADIFVGQAEATIDLK